MPSFFRARKKKRAATLPEVLIAMAILLVLMISVLEYCALVERTWKSASVDPFADAENAFETVNRNLAAATLEPYQDYADTSGAFRTNSAFVPDHLARRSDLDFVCGPASGATGLLTAGNRTTTGSAVFFLVPGGVTQTYPNAGMDRLLNAMGYFVEFGDDNPTPSFLLLQTHAWRWRLKQVVQPAESLQIFATTNSSGWIQQVVPASATFPILADNVIALIVLPERAASDSGAALAPAFSYDTRDAGNKLTLHQLPSRLRVVLVAIDETSAFRLAAQSGTNPPQLVSDVFFQHGTQLDAVKQRVQLDADLAALDSSLTAQKINHRILQRDILLPSANWSNTASE
jgi:uncharacterized protein (TIGR02599 family)